MKKRILLISLLTAAVLLCAACSASEKQEPQNTAQAATGQVAPMDQQATDAPSVPAAGSYDPAAEEKGSAFPVSANKVYAGATPILLDPIDMPTATPRPELEFTYGDYTASKLGLTFRSAVGYEINENLQGKYILTEPAAAVQDNYPCTITLEITGITKAYTVADVKTSLSRYLAEEGKQYDSWETWQAASKTLMGGKGYYNNYRGVLADGTIVRGRVHMAIINDTQLLTLHISCPGWFNSSYMKIYDAIHSSIKAVQ